MISSVYNMDEAARMLHKSRRWLQDWLRANPADATGHPFYTPLGRTKTFDANDIVRMRALAKEQERCRLSSSRREKARRKTGTSGAPTSTSLWTTARELLKSGRRAKFSGSGKPKLRLVSSHRGPLRRQLPECCRGL